MTIENKLMSGLTPGKKAKVTEAISLREAQLIPCNNFLYYTICACIIGMTGNVLILLLHLSEAIA
jgi:hypothetical protein